MYHETIEIHFIKSIYFIYLTFKIHFKSIKNTPKRGQFIFGETFIRAYKTLCLNSVLY